MVGNQNIFLSLIKLLGIPHTKGFTQYSYEEHPYKYSFYGLKNLAESYNIECKGVYIADKSEIKDLPIPFIAECFNDYILVKDISEKQVNFDIYNSNSVMSLTDFINSWDGHALLFFPNENSKEPNLKQHRKDSLYSIFEYIVFCISCTLLFTCIFAKNLALVNATSILLLAITTIGIILSTLLLFKQINIFSNLTESICTIFKKGSCNNVLESQNSKLFNRYSWAEVGFVYFTSNFIIMACLTEYTQILSWISILALPYSAWSIAYQKRTSQWCPLCLVVQCVIVSQFIIFLANGYYNRGFCISMLTDTLYTFSIYGIVGVITHKSIPLIEKSHKLIQVKWKYNHLKMKTEVFHSLLSVQDNYPTDGSNILFGPQSLLRVTVFSNPYCNPCAIMHKRLQELVESKKVQVQYVFTSFKPEWNDINKYMIAAYQQLGAEKAWQIYTEWYKQANTLKDDFFTSYHLDIEKENVLKEFNIHEKWRDSNHLEATPTILVNGYKLPYGYEIENLIYFA